MNQPFSRRKFVALSSAAAVTAALGSGCTLQKTEEEVKTEEPKTSVVRFACGQWNCTGTCGQNVYVKDGSITKVEPADMGDDYYQRNICLKGITYAMQQVTSADRIKYPMRRVGERGAGDWERISWDEAMTEIVDKFNKVKEEYGPKSVAGVQMTGNLSIIAYNAPQRMMNLVGGTWISFIGLMSDGAQAYGFMIPLGTSDVANGWDDMLDGSNFLITVGQNIPAVKNGYMRYVLDAQERGMYYAAFDPRFSRGVSKADEWVPVRPGTDPALLLGMMQHIIANNWHDEKYLKAYTNAPFLIRSDSGMMLKQTDLGNTGEAYVVLNATGDATAEPSADVDCTLYGEYTATIDGAQVKCSTAWKLFVDSLNSTYTPEQAADITEISADKIKDLADRYANKGPSTIRVGQGSTRYYNGHLSPLNAVVLALICGNIGTKHAGVSWESGSFDIFGGNLPTGWDEWIKVNTKVEIPDQIPGDVGFEAIRTGNPYPIKALWISQYGIGSQAPETENLFESTLSKLDFIVVSDTLMNYGAKFADIVLPVVSYYECPTGDMVCGYDAHKLLQRSQQVIPPLWEAKSDWDIGRAFADKLGLLDLWDKYGSTVEENMEWSLANNTAPEIQATDWTEWREKGVSRLNMKQPWVALEDKNFPTSTGRAHIYFEEFVEFDQQLPCHSEPIESNRTELAQKYPLTFMTAHPYFSTHGQNVTLPWIREFVPEPTLDMNPIDASARGLKDGDMVRVFNDRGSFKVKLYVNEGIKPGCLNNYQGWWPEHYAEGHHGNVTHYKVNPMQASFYESNWAACDNLVEVEKA